MRKRGPLPDSLSALKRIEGIAAVPPSQPDAEAAHRASGGDAVQAGPATDALASRDADLFRKAGWSFVEQPAGEGIGTARPVFEDGEGHVKIDSGSLNVRFAKGLSEGEIERLLHDHGLAIRRQLGFAPNLFTVSGRSGAAADSLEVARSLESSDKVEYAEPVLIEALGGR